MKRAMTIGLLQCDHVRPELLEVGGDYNAMFADLFRRHAPEVNLEAFMVCDGQFPESDACDAFITTGSAVSVYEELPWIERLTEFVRKLYEENRILIGICFGHQLIAHALGGVVRQSGRGWGIGSKVVSVGNHCSWMRPPMNALRLLLSHQDQVEQPPPGAVILGSNDHCPNSVMMLGGRFLSFQGHPEFSPAYARALMLARQDRIPADVIQAALPTFDQSLDDAVAVAWMLEFIARQDGRA